MPAVRPHSPATRAASRRPPRNRSGTEPSARPPRPSRPSGPRAPAPTGRPPATRRTAASRSFGHRTAIYYRPGGTHDPHRTRVGGRRGGFGPDAGAAEVVQHGDPEV